VTLQNFSDCEGLSLPTKQFVIGKNALPPFLLTSCEPNARAQSARFSLSMKPTFESRENGAICIEALMRMAIWWM